MAANASRRIERDDHAAIHRMARPQDGRVRQAHPSRGCSHRRTGPTAPGESSRRIDRVDANQIWKSPTRSPGSRARTVRAMVDRGADEAGRRARPRRHPPGAVAAGPDRHRRARSEPGRVQAADAGRESSTSCQTTPARVAGSTRTSPSCCSRRRSACRCAPMPAGSGSASGPAPVDVRLRRRSGTHRKPGDRGSTTCTSTSSTRSVIDRARYRVSDRPRVLRPR